MPGDHALLSPSSAHRWLNCPPSARLDQRFEDKPSVYAEEGTEAHALCEYQLKKALGREAEYPVPGFKHFSTEMMDCADAYVECVMEQVAAAKETCPDPMVLTEQRVDFSRWVRDGFGTADCLIVSDGTLRVIDYKHGLGVPVAAEDNPQMKCYALGAIELFGALYDIDRVAMTICQPRRENITTSELAVKDLLAWAQETLKPAADLAWGGQGEFKCGAWCGFCKAQSVCRARAEANLMLAKYEFKLPPVLSDTEIEVVLSKVDELVKWATDVKDFALAQALRGKAWTGWKLVEGRANRRYTNEDEVIRVVSGAGYDPFEKKPLGITAMQKLLGKARFDELLSALIEKPRGKPTLVPESDKRPAVVNFDFTEENGD